MAQAELPWLPNGACFSPEVRSYRMRYVKGNDPLGDPSDTLTVTTTP